MSKEEGKRIQEKKKKENKDNMEKLQNGAQVPAVSETTCDVDGVLYR